MASGEELLRVPAKDRGKWLKEQADQAVTGAALNALKAADTAEALVAALERKVARELTPNIVPPGAMVLQPSEERRRSGSHYTPRSLTEPIVRKALEPNGRRNLTNLTCWPVNSPTIFGLQWSVKPVGAAARSAVRPVAGTACAFSAGPAAGR